MSLGGKTTETQQIDPQLKEIALEQLAMAKRVGQLGFVPYQGATVAGMQPGQIAAMQNTNAGLAAFGLGGTPIPAAGDLSPYAMYQEQLAQMAPGQRAFIDAMFINPMTGQMQAMPYGNGAAVPVQTAPGQMATVAAMPGGGGRAADAAMQGGGGRATTSLATPASYMPGGVNTRDPGSLANRVAAAFSGPQSAPTQANRPVARAVATTNPSKATKDSMAKAAAANQGRTGAATGGKSVGGSNATRR